MPRHNGVLCWHVLFPIIVRLLRGPCFPRARPLTLHTYPLPRSSSGVSAFTTPAFTLSGSTFSQCLNALGSCSEGGYCAGTAARAQCPAGFFCPPNVNAPIPCPAGTASAAGASSCMKCADGQTYLLTTDSSCTPCPPGTTSSQYTMVCESCPYGKINPTAGGTCSTCNAPRVPSADKTSCVVCPVGMYYADYYGSCDYCPTNTYALSGSSACTSCSTGRYSATVGATSADACTAPCPQAGEYFGSTTAMCVRLAELSTAVIVPLGSTSPARDCVSQCASGGYTIAFATGGTLATLIPGYLSAAIVGSCSCAPMVGTMSSRADAIADLDCGLAAGAASMPCSLTDNGFSAPTLVRTVNFNIPLNPTVISTFGFVGCSAGAGGSYGPNDVCAGSLVLTYKADTVPDATACQRACGIGSYTLTAGKSFTGSRSAFLTPFVANTGSGCLCSAFRALMNVGSGSVSFSGYIPGTNPEVYFTTSALSVQERTLTITLSGGSTVTYDVSSCNGVLATWCGSEVRGASPVTAPVASTATTCLSTTGAALSASLCGGGGGVTGSGGSTTCAANTYLSGTSCVSCPASSPSAPAGSTSAAACVSPCAAAASAAACAALGGGCVWSGFAGASLTCANAPAKAAVGVTLTFNVASGTVAAFATFAGTVDTLKATLARALGVPASAVTIISITASAGSRRLAGARGLQVNTAVVVSSITADAVAASPTISALVTAAGGTVSNVAQLAAAVAAYLPTAAKLGTLYVAAAAPGTLTTQAAVIGGVAPSPAAATGGGEGAGAAVGGALGGVAAVGLAAGAYYRFVYSKRKAMVARVVSPAPKAEDGH